MTIENWLWDFVTGLSVTWIAVSVWELLRMWWLEAKQDFKVEGVGQTELLHNIKAWRGKP